MSAIEDAIRSAGEKGYKDYSETSGSYTRKYHSDILLDPLFWQAYAKAKRLDNPDEGICAFSGDWVPRNPAFLADCSCHREACLRWDTLWHRFIDHLAEGKSAEEFFATLV